MVCMGSEWDATCWTWVYESTGHCLYFLAYIDTTNKRMNFMTYPTITMDSVSDRPTTILTRTHRLGISVI